MQHFYILIVVKSYDIIIKSIFIHFAYIIVAVNLRAEQVPASLKCVKIFQGGALKTVQMLIPGLGRVQI
jgi:hypothetical protein